MRSRARSDPQATSQAGAAIVALIMSGVILGPTILGWVLGDTAWMPPVYIAIASILAMVIARVRRASKPDDCAAAALPRHSLRSRG